MKTVILIGIALGFAVISFFFWSEHITTLLYGTKESMGYQDVTYFVSVAVAALVASVILLTILLLRRHKEMGNRLYDKRLEVYPEAFEATNRLSRKFLYQDRPTPDKLKAVRDRLEVWFIQKAGFLLSKQSTIAFYELRDYLSGSLQEGQEFSEDQVDEIWRAKNRLQKCLRKDVSLPHVEEPTAK